MPRTKLHSFSTRTESKLSCSIGRGSISHQELAELAVSRYWNSGVWPPKILIQPYCMSEVVSPTAEIQNIDRSVVLILYSGMTPKRLSDGQKWLKSWRHVWVRGPQRGHVDHIARGPLGPHLRTGTTTLSFNMTGGGSICVCKLNLVPLGKQPPSEATALWRRRVFVWPESARCGCISWRRTLMQVRKVKDTLSPRRVRAYRRTVRSFPVHTCTHTCFLSHRLLLNEHQQDVRIVSGLFEYFCVWVCVCVCVCVYS